MGERERERESEEVMFDFFYFDFKGISQNYTHSLRIMG